MLRQLLAKAGEDKAARAAVLYLVSGVLVQAIALGLSPFWTRAMTMAEYGIIAVVQPIGVFVAAISGLGLDHGVARLVHDESRGSSSQRDVAKTIVTVQLLAQAAVLACGLAAVRVAETPLDGLLGFASRPYLDLALLGGFLGSAANTLTRTSQTFELPWPVFWSRSSEALSRGGLIVVLVVLWGMQGEGMLIARAAGAGISAIVVLFALRDLAKGTLKRGTIGPALQFSLPLLPYQLLALVLDGADRIILNEYRGEVAVAPYALAYAIGGGGMLLVVNSLVHAEAPSFYQAVRRHDYQLAGRRVIRRIEAMGVVAVVINLLGGPAVRFLYDQRYGESAALVPLIVSGLFCWGVFSFKNLTLLEQKRSALSSSVTITTALANLGLNFALIPTWGASGAAGATMVAYGLQALAGVSAERAASPIPQHLGRLFLVTVSVLSTSLLAYSVLLG